MTGDISGNNETDLQEKKLYMYKSEIIYTFFAKENLVDPTILFYQEALLCRVIANIKILNYQWPLKTLDAISVAFLT